MQQPNIGLAGEPGEPALDGVEQEYSPRGTQEARDYNPPRRAAKACVCDLRKAASSCHAMQRRPLLIAALLAPLLVLQPLPGLADNASAARAQHLWDQLDTRKLKLRSKAALVVDRFGNTLYQRDSEQPMPIASVTKLMTAMVTLDAKLPLDEVVEITKADRDTRRLTGSRLNVGARLTRGELLTLALMASENRAAAALGRTFPGGTAAFVRTMNKKAATLGMHNTRFADAAGLDAANVSTARDLARMVFAAMRYPAIREATTRTQMDVRPYKKRGPLRYVNTNRLMRNDNWDIQISKTGYINEAGRCLVMHTEFNGTPTVLVLLNSFGKLTPFGDANRVRKWIEKGVDSAGRKSAQTGGEDRTTG